MSGEIRQLEAYWETLRDGRLVPYRSEVDPRDMDCSARNLFVVEEGPPGNHRFRLAGSGLVEAFGMELRGMTAKAIMEGPARESLAALLAETLAEPGIGYARLREAGEDGAPWELLLLPLRTDTGRIERLLGALVPLGAARPRAPAAPPLRFSIETMRIRPVERAADAAAGPAEAAEPAAAFDRTGAPSTRLTPIDGGRTGDAGAGGDRREADPCRPDLRVVRDE